MVTLITLMHTMKWGAVDATDWEVYVCPLLNQYSGEVDMILSCCAVQSSLASRICSVDLLNREL
jgi:hypothetical protein